MVAFFVISTQLGGAERSLLDFLKRIDSSPKNILVVTPKATGPLIDELLRLKLQIEILPIPDWILKFSRKNKIYNVFLLPFALLFFLLYLLQIHQAVKRRSIQRIHSTGIKYHLILGFYSLLQKRVKITLHMRDIVHSSLLRQIYRLFSTYGKVDFIANSKATANSLSPIPSKLIYNGFDSRSFSKSSNDVKQKLNIPESDKLVAIVGVIARWKGQREFIEMARMIRTSRQDVQFLIVGDEIYDTQGDQGELQVLKSQVIRLGLQNCVHFLGFQKMLAPIYSAVDVLAHCSIHPEPFGRVIVEAMLCGCPVTASSLGGPLEIITPEINGLLHHPSDIAHITKNVERILNNPEFAQKISQQALIDAGKFSMDSYVGGLKIHFNIQNPTP